VPAVADLLIGLVAKCKASAGVPADTTLAAFGACMSGFMEKGPQDEVVALMSARAPGMAASYYIDNDSPGSIYTAAGGAGGSVIICGTGSMAQLLTPGGDVVNCNGHGHMFGDEGSAYYIASTAIRHVFRGLDTFSDDADTAVPDVSAARDAMLRYFGIASPAGMLDVMYKAFVKAHVAGFARVLAELAAGDAAKGVAPDAFAAWVFAQAGRQQGSFARTLAPHLLPAGAPPGARDVTGFHIVCVGSVWKSWPLLAPSSSPPPPRRSTTCRPRSWARARAPTRRRCRPTRVAACAPSASSA
jgi:hypothetical protein